MTYNESYLKSVKRQWDQDPLTRNSYTYEEWIILNTRWTHEQFIGWVANGRQPRG